MDHDKVKPHWTQLLIKEGWSYELTQPLSELDDCLPVRSRDGSALMIRQDILLQTFEEACKRPVASELDALTALLTAYVLLQPYVALVRDRSDSLTIEDVPFSAEVWAIKSNAYNRQIEAFDRYGDDTYDFGRLCGILPFVLSDEKGFDYGEELVSQSPLQLLRIKANFTLADLANHRRISSPTVGLLHEATKRTLSLSEASSLFKAAPSAASVSIDEMMKIAEQNPRIALDMMKRCVKDDGLSSHVSLILSNLGTHLPPSAPRFLDLCWSLSGLPGLVEAVWYDTLPTYLSRSFDHIRASERHGSNAGSQEDTDPTLLPYERIPRAIDDIIGFMDRTGFLHELKHPESMQEDTMQNLAIEVKAFALDMVKYKVAHELLKYVM